jgi:hypothetical protein
MQGRFVLLPKFITDMITLTDNQLSIHLPHPCPADFLAELQLGVIDALRNQQALPHSPLDEDEAGNVRTALLELLRALMAEPEGLAVVAQDAPGMRA